MGEFIDNANPGLPGVITAQRVISLLEEAEVPKEQIHCEEIAGSRGVSPQKRITISPENHERLKAHVERTARESRQL